MKRLSTLALLGTTLALSAFGTGCGRHGLVPALFVTGVVIETAAHISRTQERNARAAEGAEIRTPANAAYGGPVDPNVYQVMPASARDQVQNAPKKKAFDRLEAKAAIEATEVQPCREAGAQPGYGHAVLDIEPDGHVSKVTLDSPVGLDLAAVSCLGSALGKVRVSPFEGGPIRLGTTFQVR